MGGSSFLVFRSAFCSDRKILLSLHNSSHELLLQALEYLGCLGIQLLILSPIAIPLVDHESMVIRPQFLTVQVQVEALFHHFTAGSTPGDPRFSKVALRFL